MRVEQYALAMEGKKPLSELVVEKQVSGARSRGQVVEQLTQSPPRIVYKTQEVADFLGVARSIISQRKYRKTNPMPVNSDGSYDLDAIKLWGENEFPKKDKDLRDLPGEDPPKEVVICKAEGCKKLAAQRKDGCGIINGYCTSCMNKILTTAKRKKTGARGRAAKEIADIFGVTTSTVYNWLHRKNPMPINEDGTYNLDEIDAWLKSEGLRTKRVLQTKKKPLKDLEEYPEAEKCGEIIKVLEVELAEKRKQYEEDADMAGENREEDLLPVPEGIVILDLDDYPKIEQRLVELSERSMLPVAHIVMSLIGEGLARKCGKAAEARV